MLLALKITVTDDPNISVETHARGVSESEIRPALARALGALKAEIDALGGCPYHGLRKAIPDADLVCTTCRWRGGHSPDCIRRDEPWPTIPDEASPHQ